MKNMTLAFLSIMTLQGCSGLNGVYGSYPVSSYASNSYYAASGYGSSPYTANPFTMPVPSNISIDRARLGAAQSVASLLPSILGY